MSGFGRSGEGYFVSYRDPNVEETNQVYEGIVDYLEHFDADDRDMTKYVIGTISALDTPMTPADQGARGLSAYLSGVTGEMLQEEGNGYEFCPTSVYRTMKPMYQAFAGITATQIHRFKESRRFCGRCGHETEDSKTERALVCPFCGQVEYPKISPAVIVAVTDGDRLLMSRYRVSHNPYRSYALIAGFVEIGETFEDTVRREVMEEVGLKVKNIRYYKSQPWAFSDTEMIGYFAELDGDDAITLQEDELSEAGWFHRSEIPDEEVLNSIGSELKMVFKYGSMEAFLERKPEAKTE